MAREIKGRRIDYLNQVFGFKNPLLELLHKEAEKEQVLHMQISPYEGRILTLLTKILQPSKVVEIGTLFAYSTFHIAQGLSDNGKIWTCDIEQNCHKKARNILKNSKEYQKIHWIQGPAQKTLKTLEKEAPFDMVFIDADKGSYNLYLDWAEEHLRSGGFLLADNTFLFGSVYGEGKKPLSPHIVEGMKKFNKRLSHSEKWMGALLPTEEGLTLAVKK